MHRWKSGASVGQVFVEDKGKTWLLQGISPLDALRPLEEASNKIGCIRQSKPVLGLRILCSLVVRLMNAYSERGCRSDQG